MMCDYLFPGEGGHEALISLGELMDMAHRDMKEHDIVDGEGQPDLHDLYGRAGEDVEGLSLCGEGGLAGLEGSSPLNPSAPANIARVSLALALLALILSLLYHLLFTS